MVKAQLPSFHVVKRTDISTGKSVLFRVLAIALALVTGGLFLLLLGHNPIEVYGTMLKGALGTVVALRETVKITVPLLITSLAITLAFKMRFWNIGAEGQICMGAIAATYFALFCNSWPTWILLPTMMVAGFVAGGLWGMIPAIFKARFGTNETLFTLMLNYVAQYFIQFFKEGSWKDPNSLGFPRIAMFEKSARMPLVLGVHAGWIVALVLVALVYVYIKFTKQGYEISVVGENENTARYAGMNVSKIIIRTMFLSGAVAGIAGMLQASGADKTLTDTVAGGVGFSAITVAWLSRLNPVAILIVSFLFGMLEKSSSTIQSVYSISTSAAEVFQGIILFFVLGCEFFIGYKLMSERKGA